MASAVAEHGQWDGVLPQPRLLAECHPGQDEPTRFWLSDLSDSTSSAPLERRTSVRVRAVYMPVEKSMGIGGGVGM
ncbi:hypothetical protein ACH5A3_44310 [Streptomyces echinatus]|uniref:hypothetical protein n=1 Tax=Streptomyces echinatus TaxID=67293 RepID=UPI0037935695